MRAPLAADLIRIGRFDVVRMVRLRGFYLAEQLSLRLQTGRARSRRGNGVTRTVDAHAHVAAHAPGLMPAVRDHRAGRRVAWLVEDLTDGRHPRAPELHSLAIPLGRRLARLHRGVGIDHVPLSKIVHPELVERWRDFSTRAELPARLYRSVADLVRRDALLEVSLGHGDLVPSNILVDGDDPVLVDWEFAGSQPIAFDLAKLHRHAVEPDTMVADLWTSTGRTLGTGRDHYSFDEQLALGHVQMLSWHSGRSARAARAARTAALRRDTDRRVGLIARLLGEGTST